MQLIAEVFNGNAIHQYCTFHLNQDIANEFSRHCPMKDELIKYRLFNIFYDRDEEINYLKKICEEESSTNFKDEKRRKSGERRQRSGFTAFCTNKN